MNPTSLPPLTGDNLSARALALKVLLSLARLITDERTDTPAADALPLEDGRYRRLGRPVFADPAHYFTQYLSAAFALPSWLAERWVHAYPKEECVRLGFWFAGPAP